MDRSSIEDMLDALNLNGVGVTEWERGFLANVEAYFLAGNELTIGQEQKLEQIHEQRVPLGLSPREIVEVEDGLDRLNEQWSEYQGALG
jgi:hypothetical protein